VPASAGRSCGGSVRIPMATANCHRHLGG
jgi:hypothetical protein